MSPPGAISDRPVAHVLAIDPSVSGATRGGKILPVVPAGRNRIRQKAF
jgi:hypothetical protein